MFINFHAYPLHILWVINMFAIHCFFFPLVYLLIYMYIIYIFIRPSSDGTYYGMVMSVRVSVRPSVRPVSVRPVSVRPFSALFSYMLWHIELKFCTWLSFNVLQIKFECHYFASMFEGVMPLCELRIWEIQFSALFSYMLWHIELKFCTWLCFDELQSKFECCHFASIFEGIMLLCELRISLSDVELKFCTWLCFNVLQIKFKCRHSATVCLSVRSSFFWTCLQYALTIELNF